MAEFITADNFATLRYNGEAYICRGSNPNFKEAIECLENEDYEGFIEICKPVKVVEHFVNNTGDETITFDGEDIYLDGHKVSNSVVQDIIDLKARGKSYDRFVRFLVKLSKNPSKRCYDLTYEFSKKHGILIAEDGDLIGLKAVRHNYLDKHSGTCCNKPGSKLEMPRNTVDDNYYHTCSKGYHIGTYSYSGPTGWFVNQTDKIVVCKFSPEDVVSIPSDINESKIRVCKYEVIDEYTEDYENKYDEVEEELSDETDEDFWADDECNCYEECPDCSEEMDDCCCEETDYCCDEDKFDPFSDDEEEEYDQFKHVHVLDIVNFMYDKNDGAGPQRRRIRVIEVLENHLRGDNIEGDKNAGQTSKLFLKSRISDLEIED